MPAQVALIGDYSPAVTAHRAIPCALELARADLNVDVGWQWIETRALDDAPRVLAAFSAVWLVPASPYANTAGALAAVRFARETGRPFLGTCGGFQHAVIEFARHVAGLPAADHAETNPSASTLVIGPLACSLVDATGRVEFAPGSHLRAAYGTDTADESYHCRYGLDAAHQAALERAGLHLTAFDRAGEVRGAELLASVHPFFVGTLFQPERAALRGVTPPLVRAFLSALARPPTEHVT
jgi:CTP synthase (UTP-ammonia lyase)